MKKIGLIALIGMTLFATGCGCQKEVKDEEIIRENLNEDVIKDQTLEVFTFTNTSLTYQDNTSLLFTKVTNTSSEAQYLKKFKIHVWGENGKEIVTLTGHVGASIGPGESKTINSTYGFDITNATSITYEIVR